MLNVCYVLLLDELLAAVRAERQALMISAVFGGKPEIPDVIEAQRALDKQLSEPLPVIDETTVDLRRALGLTA